MQRREIFPARAGTGTAAWPEVAVQIAPPLHHTRPACAVSA
ncbi:hypothetical protein CDS [Bradyrhizobium sp.]|nr:hypothetical protein CDS [Bradyrhizobium sp.]